MKCKVYFTIVITFLFNVSLVCAQQVISSAGASATGTGVQLSWTIGEPVIETFTGGSAILTQGFQQSKLNVTAVEPNPLSGISLSVYPNPFTMALQLDITGANIGNLDYRIFDISGKLLIVKKVVQKPENISMGNYPSGVYLLKVFRNSDEPLQTFKIVKN